MHSANDVAFQGLINALAQADAGAAAGAIFEECRPGFRAARTRLRSRFRFRLSGARGLATRLPCNRQGVLPSWCAKQMTLRESLTEMVCIRETKIGQNNEYFADMPAVYTMHLP